MRCPTPPPLSEERRRVESTRLVLVGPRVEQKSRAHSGSGGGEGGEGLLLPCPFSALDRTSLGVGVVRD